MLKRIRQARPTGPSLSTEGTVLWPVTIDRLAPAGAGSLAQCDYPRHPAIIGGAGRVRGPSPTCPTGWRPCAPAQAIVLARLAAYPSRPCTAPRPSAAPCAFVILARSRTGCEKYDDAVTALAQAHPLDNTAEGTTTSASSIASAISLTWPYRRSRGHAHQPALADAHYPSRTSISKKNISRWRSSPLSPLLWSCGRRWRRHCVWLESPGSTNPRSRRALAGGAGPPVGGRRASSNPERCSIPNFPVTLLLRDCTGDHRRARQATICSTSCKRPSSASIRDLSMPALPQQPRHDLNGRFKFTNRRRVAVAPAAAAAAKGHDKDSRGVVRHISQDLNTQASSALNHAPG